MVKKKLDTSTFSNAADEAVLADIEKRRAAGEDVFGDEEEGEATAAADAPPGDTPPDDLDDDTPPAGDATQVGANDAKPAAEAAQAPPGDATTPTAAIDEPAAALAPVVYQTPTRADLEKQRDTLLTEKGKAFDEFDEGTITREQYLARVNAADTSLMDLSAKAALQEANEQTRLAAQDAKLKTIKEAAKKAGVLDYDTDEAAADEFDAAMVFVAKVPANAKLSFDQLADKAHAAVLAQRGITTAPPPPPPPPLRGAPPIPLTLGNVPAAAQPNGTGGINEELSRLNGLDFQERIGAMPKAQRDAWLDS
jgi:hypothetical protein